MAGRSRPARYAPTSAAAGAPAWVWIRVDLVSRKVAFGSGVAATGAGTTSRILFSWGAAVVGVGSAADAVATTPGASPVTAASSTAASTRVGRDRW